MTVIAYRAGLMACDSCWATNGTQNASAIKIVRLSSGALLGQAGDNDARAIVDLLDKIKTPDKLPSRKALAETKTDFEGLIAFRTGGVWMVSTGPHDDAGYPATEDADYGCWPATTMGGYAAVGSGADYALSAMDAGATAKQAVEIACRRDIHCRLPVHVLKLNPARR
jgi:hypothetical protein